MQSNIDLDTPIKFFPLISDGHNAGALWSLCRGMDKSGAGKISFTMQEMMSILGVSRVTINRYLKSNLFFTRDDILGRRKRDLSNYNFPLDKHIFHYNKLGEVVYTLYYKSIYAVAEILCLNVKKLEYAYVTPTKLHKSNKKILATEILVSVGQKCAYNAIYKHQIRNRDVPGIPQKITTTSDIFANLSENDKYTVPSGLGIKRISNEVLLINSDVSKVAVVSHNTIAKKMGRHRTTISKRLQKSTVEKKRILLTNRAIKAEGGLYFKQHPDHTYCMSEEGKLLINVSGIPCQKYCSMYNLDYKTTRHTLVSNIDRYKTKIVVNHVENKIENKVEKATNNLFNKIVQNVSHTFYNLLELKTYIDNCKSNLLSHISVAYNLSDLETIYQYHCGVKDFSFKALHFENRYPSGINI